MYSHETKTLDVFERYAEKIVKAMDVLKFLL